MQLTFHLDINECNSSPCDPLTQCQNTVGSYNCTACPIGYTGDGKTECTGMNLPYTFSEYVFYFRHK